MKYGMFGGNMYYGTGYVPTLDENEQQVDPEHCVIYTVTSYPDYMNKAQHITRIEITDPEIELYGLSINSSKEDIKAIKEFGFNSIRIPFHYKNISKKYKRLNDDAFILLDKTIELCKKYERNRKFGRLS